MAAALVVNYEAESPKSFDNFPARKGPAHNLISTSRRVTPGPDFIWFTFSRPSR